MTTSAEAPVIRWDGEVIVDDGNLWDPTRWAQRPTFFLYLAELDPRAFETFELVDVILWTNSPLLACRDPFFVDGLRCWPATKPSDWYGMPLCFFRKLTRLHPPMVLPGVA